MSLVTVTFDSDEWQVVPKKATAEMKNWLCGGFMTDQEQWEYVLAAAPQPPAVSAEPASYVQTVPDHCDRIIWRGRYYHLPIAPQPPVMSTEPVAWLWERRYSNGGYTRKVVEFESQAKKLAEDSKNLPTPDIIVPLYPPPQPPVVSAWPVTDPEHHPDFYTWTWDVLVSGNWQADYGWRRPVAPVKGLKPLFTAPQPVVSAEPVAWKEFNEWMHWNMPSGTIVGDPGWWASRIYQKFIKKLTPRADAKDAASIAEAQEKHSTECAIKTLSRTASEKENAFYAAIKKGPDHGAT